MAAYSVQENTQRMHVSSFLRHDGTQLKEATSGTDDEIHSENTRLKKLHEHLQPDTVSENISINVQLVADDSIRSTAPIHVIVKVPSAVIDILRSKITDSVSKTSCTSSERKTTKVRMKTRMLRTIRKFLKNRTSAFEKTSDESVSTKISSYEFEDTSAVSVSQEDKRIHEEISARPTENLQYTEEKHKFVLPVKCGINDKIYAVVKPGTVESEVSIASKSTLQNINDNFVEECTESVYSYENKREQILTEAEIIETPLSLRRKEEMTHNKNRRKINDNLRSKELLEMFVGNLQSPAELNVLPKRQLSKISFCSSIESDRYEDDRPVKLSPEEMCPNKTNVNRANVIKDSWNSLGRRSSTWTNERLTDPANFKLNKTDAKKEKNAMKMQPDNFEDMNKEQRELVEAVVRWWGPRISCATTPSTTEKFSSYSTTMDDVS